MADNGPKKQKYNQMRSAGMYAMLPTVMVASPAIGWYLGHLIRGWLNTGQWPEVVGAVLGMVAGFREVVRIIKRGSEQDAQ